MTTRVLVVDDDAGIRELLKFRLTKSCFEVATRANGHECIKHLRTEALPDLVLLDVMMPRMNGLETLETIRTNLDADVPVVLLTGKQSRTDAVLAAKHLTKLFTVDEVVACVERVVDGG